MATGSRAEKLIQAYDQERQDERTYWWTTSTLMIAALAAVLALTTAPLGDNAWGVWVVTPLFSNLILAYHVHQSAMGARRRLYLEAIERELSKGEQALEIDSGAAVSDIRPMAYNRYSWSLASNQKTVAPQWLARLFFRAMTFIPLFLLLCVEVTSVWRLAEGHRLWAIFVGLLSAAMTAFLVYSLWKLTDDWSRKKSWSTAPPIP
jgi:hypothetical protein